MVVGGGGEDVVVVMGEVGGGAEVVAGVPLPHADAAKRNRIDMIIRKILRLASRSFIIPRFVKGTT